MIGVVVNPRARRNRRRSEDRAEQVAALVGAQGRVVTTPDLASLATAVRELHAEGTRYWVADGGDGSLHWLVNVVRDELGDDALRTACFVATRSGTVNLVAQNARVDGRSDDILRRLVDRVAHGLPVPVAEVPALRCDGAVDAGGGPTPVSRYGFAFAIGGYGANFFGPYDRNVHLHPTVAVTLLTGRAFAAGLSRAVLRGPARHLRPPLLRRDEAEFLAPLRAHVALDGELFRGRDGHVVEDFTALHASSVPINLAGVFRVFPQAEHGAMHAHGGHISATQMVVAMPSLVGGRPAPLHLLPDAFDGPYDTLDVTCLGDARCAPIIDGERYTDFVRISLRAALPLRVAVP